MSEVELNEAFLVKIAGWEAIKAARQLVAGGKVLSSDYTPPILKGVVQDGPAAYRSGLVVKAGMDLENLCTCRASRQWGTICAHAVAVGLHFLKPPQPTAPAAMKTEKAGVPLAASSAASARRLRRATAGEAAAEKVELHVLVPPNFLEAAKKGKVMLVFEARWSRGRVPLNALPDGQPFQLDAADERLLSRIEELAGEPPGVLVVSTPEFTALLPALVDHPRITLGKGAALRVTAERWFPAVAADLQVNGDIILRLRGESGVSLIDEWLFRNATLQPFGLAKPFDAVLNGPVRITRAEVPAFLNNDFPMLQAAGTLQTNFSVADFVVDSEPPVVFLHLAGGLAQLSAQLQFKYGARILPAGGSLQAPDRGGAPWLPDPENARRYLLRDLAAEQAALARLIRAGFGPDSQGQLQLNGNDRVLAFFAREYPRLQKTWQVSLEERLQRSTNEKIERIEPRFEITSSGIQWFDFGVTFASNSGEQFSPADIQRLILSGQSHTRLRNGRTAVIDTGAVEELSQFLLDASPMQQQGRYRLSNVQAGFLEATLQQQGWQAQAPQAWRERAMQQSGEAALTCPPLGDLEDVLRPYQKNGVAWISFLRANGFGGILADEMGLGKTLQALAFLRTVTEGRRQAAEGRGCAPHLIICPTSLVFNWVSEALKFTPQLAVLGLHGPNRHRLFAEISSSDIVVTSYALIRRDWERYAALEFDTVILDEAQHIKNRATQNAQAVKAIRSAHRVVLTGTPLENSVLDLWSIFDFLMPGYLGSAKDFRERYELPIAREKNSDAQARLSRRLKPFILRRLKRDVAADLPSKIEQVTFCELTSEQRGLYQQVMDFSRKEVLEAVGAQGFARSRLVIFNALLRLRKICCDLRLLGREVKDQEAGDGRQRTKDRDQAEQEAHASSGKMEAFDELLQEIVDGGHRVLVFSQFVSMLKLLEQQLQQQDIAYCYLDGSTVNRGEVVARFQGGTAPVFLISLKAGGVGLNLTAADTVVHFDPWWNPAVEDQATDRAHRIGQKRVVTSYKLIMRDTIEEKILTLQQKKREIIKATLGEEEFADALNWNDIQELFS